MTGQGGVRWYWNWEKWFSSLGSQSWFGQIIHKRYWTPAMVWLGWEGRWRIGYRFPCIWLVCLLFLIVIVLMSLNLLQVTPFSFSCHKRLTVF